MIRWQSLPTANDEVYNEALLESLERCHDTLWDSLEMRPGWEVIVHDPSNGTGSHGIETLDITFAFHHAYADGVASKLFHTDLLRALNDPDKPPKELNDHVLRDCSPAQLLPDMETIVPLKISWTYLLRMMWTAIIWQDLVPDWFKSKPPAASIPWTGQAVSMEPYRVRIHLIEVSQSALAGLLKICRQHKATLTPLLHVLIAASLASRLPAASARVFSFSTPIDLRRCAKPDFDVEMNITGLASAHEDMFDAPTIDRLRRTCRETNRDERRDASVWQMASALSARLRQKVSSLPNDDIMGMLSWVSDWQKYWSDKLGKKRSSTWEVSNLGSLKAAEGDDHVVNDWVITRSVFTQGALPAGSAFSVNVCGVEGEGLCITLSWQETIVEDQLTEGLRADLKKYLDDLGNVGELECSGDR